MEQHKRIEINPEIMFGKPVIKGTRITIEQILYKLADGMAPAEIIEAHPRLNKEDIRDAQRFAADYMGSEEIMTAYKL